MKEIAFHLRSHTSKFSPSFTSKANQLLSENAFGETQLDMDVQIDSMIYDFLKESKYVAMAISEERPYPTYLNKKSGEFNVCFDPVDGSNILESNYAVGSIFGIFPNG